MQLRRLLDQRRFHADSQRLSAVEAEERLLMRGDGIPLSRMHFDLIPKPVSPLGEAILILPLTLRPPLLMLATLTAKETATVGDSSSSKQTPGAECCPGASHPCYEADT
eukprot:2522451-Pleurochrysis_carterae.AAC.2